MSQPDSQRLIEQLRDGTNDAATAIYDRYLERLIALARSRLSPKMKRRVDPEDIVQSAYRSFFVHAERGDYRLSESGDLWRLLAATTLHKLYGQVEKHTAEKRAIDREGPGEALAGVDTREPSVVDLIAVGEQLGIVLDALTPDERRALSASLEGQNVEQISKAMHKSERTIRRLLQTARQRFESRLLHPQPSEKERPIEVDAPLRFADYMLEQLLGSGGMGKVYRAREQKTGNLVAVKALHKSWQSSRQATIQLVKEAQVMSELRHPGIVRVHGLGRYPGGGLFLVMDYIEGHDLQHRLQHGPLPAADALSIARQVADAVGHAHANGIIHCDLKPGNILLDQAGSAYVSDFGFAIVRADHQHSRRGFGGTAGYMAPELLEPLPNPTAAVDVYALGVLLWQMFTGHLPQPNDRLDSYTELVKPYRPICRRCLARNPAERYPDVHGLLADLEDAVGRSRFEV